MLFPHARLPFARMQPGTSMKGNFVISYPEIWYFAQNPANQRDSSVVAAIANPTVFKLGVIVFIRRSGVSYDSFDKVSKWGEEIVAKENRFESISSTKLMIRNEETELREYTWFAPLTPISSPEKMQCYGNYRLHERTGYVITLCVNAEDWAIVAPTFRQMIESFAYLD